MVRVLKTLRSPRLVVWLFGLLIGYSALGTLVAQGSAGDATVSAWASAHRSLEPLVAALGFHRAFSGPVFLLLALLLAASTIVCAWDRTTHSVKAFRSRPAGPELIERLHTSPAVVIPLTSSEEASAGIERVLRSGHLRVTRTGDVIEGVSARLGLLGSPLFHWSLALLFVVIAFGSLTRSEGVMDIVAGTSKPDLPSSYRLLDKGPLGTGASGRTIAVTDVARSFRSPNGVAQGVTPLVELRSEDGMLLARDRVYPNHPLRYGTTTIHKSGDGLGVIARLDNGVQSTRQQVLFDFDEKSPSGVDPVELSIVDQAGAPVADVRFDLPPLSSAPAGPAIALTIRPAGSSGSKESSSVVLEQGRSVSIAPGAELTAEKLSRYARLSVVDDWSVPVIYALFFSALAGLTISLLLPSRRVWVLIVRDEAGARLHVAVRHARRDPMFRQRIEAALSEAGMERAA